MAAGDISEDVRRLLREHISSLEQLEILLLLKAQPHKEWTATSVYEALRCGQNSAAARLVDLEKRGFLARREEATVFHYRYAPLDLSLQEAVSQLDMAYTQRRYTVIELIFAKPIDGLREYAGAFQFRKDK